MAGVSQPPGGMTPPSVPASGVKNPRCFSCRAEFTFVHPPGRREECPKCGADVHACLNCKHYDKSSYNECREPQAEVVKERERANFCDFFALGGGAGLLADKQKDLKAAAEALFKKKT